MFAPHLLALGARMLAGGFDRASLSPRAWYRAGSGAYQDSAGTTPATADLDVVGRWSDLSGNGHHVVQATTGSKPTLRAGRLNGLPTLAFDGSDDCLVTDSAWSALGARTVILVGRSTNGSTSNSFCDGPGNGNRTVVGRATTSWRLFAGTTLDLAGADDGWHVLVAVFDGASSKIFEDGASLGAGAAGSSTVAGLTIGASNSSGTPAQFLTGDVAELLVVPVALSDADALAAARGIGADWGFSL